jgi:hypothetical protein
MEDSKTEYQTNIRRPKSVHTRFSHDEYAQLFSAAQRDNLSLADWFRRTALASLQGQKDDSLVIVLLEEIQFVKLLLLNTIPALIRNNAISEKDFKNMAAQHIDTKTTLAQDIIKRAEKRRNTGSIEDEKTTMGS